MSRKMSKGNCSFCGETLSKNTVARHFEKCTALKRGGKKMTWILVQGSGLSEYWLHVGLSETAKLKDFDSFLRNIWLECCGHLSSFNISGVQYDAYPDPDPFFGRPAKSMASAKVVDVFPTGVKFNYEYDFGTTSELNGKSLGRVELPTSGEKVVLMARNLPPEIPCGKCGKPAVITCAYCNYEPKGWMCKSCSRDHDCGNEAFLPVVNSPRTGMCAYGSDEWDESLLMEDEE